MKSRLIPSAMVMLLIVAICTLASAVSYAKPTVHGSSFSDSLLSKVLSKERMIYVSLPDSYHLSDRRYPLILVMDAEFLFDVTAAMVKMRAARHYMPESIVVGIPNIGEKRWDMALKMKSSPSKAYFPIGGKTQAYIQFIEHELIPHSEQHYRANGHRSIIGMSPTNGPLLEAFWRDSSLFKGFISLSTDFHLYLDDGQTIGEKILKTAQQRWEKKTSSKVLKRKGMFYAARGDGDFFYTPSIEGVYQDYADKLAEFSNQRFLYKVEILKNEEHYGVALQGIHNAFATLYPRSRWNVNYQNFQRADDPLQAVKDHYKVLSEEYGFNVYPRENGFWQYENLTSLAQNIFDAGNREKAIEIFEYIRELYPYSPSNYSNMADAYQAVERIDKAKEMRRKAKKLRREIAKKSVFP